VIADRPQTIVWAFTLSSRTSIWRFMAIWPSVETLLSKTPLPEGALLRFFQVCFRKFAAWVCAEATR